MPSEFDKNEKPWFFGPQRINRTETVKVLFINPDSDIESKKDVIDRLSSNLKNGVINQDTGFLLQASRSDAKKTVFRKDLNSPIVKAIFKNAKEIASSSLHIESHCDLLHENEKVQAIHIFAVPAIIEGDLFRVELTVRDYVERDHERKMVHSIDGISIQRYEKAFVREPPAQVFSKRNLLQKTGQPTNGRLIERCGRARSSFPTLDLSLIYPLLDRNIEQKQLPRLDWRRRTRTVGILVHFCSKPSA